MCVKVRDWDACDSQQIARAKDAQAESRPNRLGNWIGKKKTKIDYDVAISLAKIKETRIPFPTWTAHFPHFLKFAVEGFFFKLDSLARHLFDNCSVIRPSWLLAGCCRQCRRSCLVFFLRLAFPSRSPAIFLLSPWSVVANSSDLQRREKESLNGDAQKSDTNPVALSACYTIALTCRLSWRKDRLCLLSPISLSLRNLILSRFIPPKIHHKDEEKDKKRQKTFRVVLSRGPKSSKYIDSSPCLRFLLRYNSCCLRICRARINPCVSLRPMPRYYKPVWEIIVSFGIFQTRVCVYNLLKIPSCRQTGKSRWGKGNGRQPSCSCIRQIKRRTKKTKRIQEDKTK